MAAEELEELLKLKWTILCAKLNGPPVTHHPISHRYDEQRQTKGLSTSFATSPRKKERCGNRKLLNAPAASPWPSNGPYQLNSPSLCTRPPKAVRSLATNRTRAHPCTVPED